MVVTLALVSLTYFVANTDNSASADTLIIRQPCAVFPEQPFPGSTLSDFGGYIDQSVLPDFIPFATKVLWADDAQLVQNLNSTHVRCTFNGADSDWLVATPERALIIPFECNASSAGKAVLTPSGKCTIVCHWDFPLLGT